MNNAEITKVETELKIKLPDSYKKVLLSYPFGEESFGSMCMLCNDTEVIIEMNKGPSAHSMLHKKSIDNHPSKNKSLFCIGNDGGEEEYYLDTSKEEGAIYEFDLETGELKEYVHDINGYIERIREIDKEIEDDERQAEERRKNAKWWEFWKKI